MVALVLDGDDFIRHHRVFEGKMSNSKSLGHIVGELEKDFPDKSMPTIIFDRGMVTAENIELLGLVLSSAT